MKRIMTIAIVTILFVMVLPNLAFSLTLVDLLRANENLHCNEPSDISCVSKYGGLVLADKYGEYHAESPSYACTPTHLGPMKDGICVLDFGVTCKGKGVDWDCTAWSDACSENTHVPTAKMTSPDTFSVEISVGAIITVDGTGRDLDGFITGYRTDVHHLSGERVQQSEGILDYTLNTHPGNRDDSRFFDKPAQLKFLKSGEYAVSFYVKDNVDCWSRADSVLVSVKSAATQNGIECETNNQCGTEMYCSYGEDDTKQSGEQGRCCPNGQFWAPNPRGNGGSCRQKSLEECSCDRSITEVMSMAKHLQDHPERLSVKVRSRFDFVIAVDSALDRFTNFLQEIGIIPDKRPDKIKPFFYEDFAYGNVDINEKCINPKTRQVCIEGTVTRFNKQYTGKYWQNYTVY